MNDFVIFGTGKIAHSLSSALLKSGYNISCAISRDINSVKSFAAKFKIKIYTTKLSEIPFNSNVYILAVPDGEIKAVANELSKLKINFRKAVFVHLSGAQNFGLLKSLKRKGAETGSLHIMQTFPSKRIVKISGCYAAVETDNLKTEKLLFKLAKSLQLIPFRLDSKLKTKYHLAGVFASNFLIANLFNAEQIFKHKEQRIYDLLEPIIISTLKNVKKAGIANALSGPIERGDIQTIENHLKSLEGNELLVYLAQSLTLLNVVKEKYGMLGENHLKVKELLEAKIKESIQEDQ